MSVALWLDADEASRTLWHELSHCAQSDRGVVGGTKALSPEAAWNDPREVEARAAEAHHDSHWPLVRPLVGAGEIAPHEFGI